MRLTEVLGVLFGLSEFALAAFRRSRGDGTRREDRGSLALIWIVVVASITACIVISGSTDVGRFHLGAAGRAIGIAVFVAGLAIRWWSIVHLGRYFTVDVAIHEDHRLVTDGPYAFARHPSYTGALLATLALGILAHNVIGLVVLMVPVTAVMLHRIGIEERALRRAFGAEYVAYAARVKALVPGVW